MKTRKCNTGKYDDQNMMQNDSSMEMCESKTYVLCKMTMMVYVGAFDLATRLLYDIMMMNEHDKNMQMAKI